MILNINFKASKINSQCFVNFIDICQVRFKCFVFYRNALLETTALFLKKVIIVCMFWLTAAQAESIQLAPDEQNAIRANMYKEHSNLMEQGGWTNEIKEGKKPKLEILDCLNEMCLINMLFSIGWDESLYLVKMTDQYQFAGMEYVSCYGHAVDKAILLPTIRAIYVKSTTHMGTEAEQLFEIDGIKVGRMFALRTMVRGKTYSKEGDQKALRLAAKRSNKINKPFKF